MSRAASTGTTSSSARPAIVVDSFAPRIVPFEAVPVVVGSALEVVVCVEDTPSDRRGDEVADGVVDDPEAGDV